ncbi:MAG: hypothetical protein ACXQTB_02450 [Candidatus Nezhaarchaeales archaeon]
MKREKRILGITGNGKIVVSVLYRGKLWFESLNVKYLEQYPMKIEEVIKSKYLDQARVVSLDEMLLKHYKSEKEQLLATIKKPIVVVKENGQLDILGYDESIRNICLRDNIPEALRIARKIFYEARGIVKELEKR